MYLYKVTAGPYNSPVTPPRLSKKVEDDGEAEVQ